MIQAKRQHIWRMLTIISLKDCDLPGKTNDVLEELENLAELAFLLDDALEVFVEEGAGSLQKGIR